MTPRIGPTPILDSLMGRIDVEPVFAGGGRYTLTAKLKKVSLVGYANLTPEQAKDKAFIRELSRAGIANFCQQALYAYNEIPKEQHERCVIGRPWRVAMGRNVDLMLQTIDKASACMLFVASNFETEHDMMALLEECEEAVGDRDEDVFLTEIKKEVPEEAA
jgi:hypothetical protein